VFSLFRITVVFSSRLY